jgi:hypothetical protein
MGRLLSLILVFIVAFLGAMAISFFEVSMTAPVDKNTERVACEIADISTENRVTEVDGVRFEIVVPQRIITIPPKEPDTSIDIEFELKITNNSSTQKIFSHFFTLNLDIIAPNSKKLNWQYRRIGRTRLTQWPDFIFLQPEESFVFTLKGKFFWDNKRFVFVRAETLNTPVWKLIDEDFKAGKYQVSLRYKSESLFSFLRGFSKYLSLKDEDYHYLWQDEVATPFIDICLINASS